MSNPTQSTTKQIHRVIIQAPIEKVWETLTKTDVVLPFFFCSVMKTTKLAVGAPVRMRSPNDRITGVTSENVPTGTKTEKQMASGGELIVNGLKVYIETGRPALISRVIGWINIVTGPFSPKRCLSVHWPFHMKIT